jgi:tRNA A-37 threonylcarbamoyl transferase component Bud32
MSTVPDSLRRSLGDRYQLEKIIGRGGMATVYRAHDPKHGRRVAVKVIRADLGEAIGPARFLREIEIAARMTHPNILPLYDSGDAEGQLYYVMPFIEDESLRALLNRVGLMDTDGAVEITRGVADALDYAHRQGIVHRDIKPENILLPGGQPVVADFGIAKAAIGAASDAGLTRTGFAVGTPGYMSPEQAAGLLDIGPTTDVYSLGVVTYEMLVGALPRAWVTPDYLAEGRFLEAEPEHRMQLDRLPPGMERALLHALALRPEERFPSPGEFAAALDSPETLTTPVRPLPAPAAASGSLAPSRQWDAEPTGTPFPMTQRTTAAAPESAGGFLGAPSTLVAERVVEGEVLPEDCDDLVEEARATFRAVGHTARAERTVIWTARRPKETGKGFDWDSILDSDDEVADILMRVRAGRGQTHIRVEQRLGGAAGGIFGGVMGGGGGGGLGVAFGVGLGALGLPVALVLAGAAGWVGGTYLLARGIYRAVVQSKQRRLESLADRLAELCEEAVG